jgi:hypothetical protein
MATDAAWEEELPRSGAYAAAVYADYRRLIVPYGVGNRHPRFLVGCMAAGPWSECLQKCWQQVSMLIVAAATTRRAAGGEGPFCKSAPMVFAAPSEMRRYRRRVRVRRYGN